MQREKIILAVILILVVVIALAGGIYYFFSALHNIKASPAKLPIKIQQKMQTPVSPTPAQQLAEINKDYPDIISGTIKFLDTKTSFESTLKADDGTTYILWPNQPEAIYESFGAKDGGRVQVHAKPLEGGKLIWTMMKPI